MKKQVYMAYTGDTLGMKRFAPPTKIVKIKAYRVEKESIDEFVGVVER